jgi:hypothetical protein
MAKYEMILRDLENGMEDTFKGEGVFLMMDEGDGGMYVEGREVSPSMYVAALVEDPNWRMARKIAEGFEKEKRKEERAAKIRRFFGFLGGGECDER